MIASALECAADAVCPRVGDANHDGKRSNTGSVASRFTRSVNIQQDLWQAESLQGYLVTAGARRALLRIAPALHTPKAVRAWTLTGPYGTGKSALANFTAKLLAGDFVPGHAAAWKFLRASDPDLAQQIRPRKAAAPAHRDHRIAGTAASGSSAWIAGGPRPPAGPPLLPRDGTHQRVA